MSENETERKSFEAWKIHIVYMTQEGRCANCGGSLAYGMGTGETAPVNTVKGGLPMEKHHADGDASNIRLDNLILYCVDCHRARLTEKDIEYKKRYESYRQYEDDLLDRLERLIELALKRDVPAASIDRIMEALIEARKLNTQTNGMNKGVFYPPPSIRALNEERRIRLETKAFVEGYKAALQSVRVEIKGTTKD